MPANVADSEVDFMQSMGDYADNNYPQNDSKVPASDVKAVAESAPQIVEEKITEVAKDLPQETEDISKNVNEAKEPINPLLVEKKTPEEIKKGKEFGESAKKLRLRAEGAEVKIKELEPKLAELELKIKELEPIREEAERWRKRSEEQEAIINRVALQETDQFKSAYSKPIAELEGKVNGIANKYEIHPQELMEALSIQDIAKRDERVASLTSAMQPIDQLRVEEAAEKILSLRKDADQILANAKSGLEAIRSANEKKQLELKSRIDAESDKAFREVWGEMQKNFGFLQKVDGNDEHNKFIDQLLMAGQQFDKDPSAISDHRRRAALVYKGFSFDKLAQYANAAIGQYKDRVSVLENKIAALTKASPKGGPNPEPSAIGSQNIDESKNFLQAMGVD